MGMSATSLTRPLVRLQELGLLAKEQPFRESERNSKKSIYRIHDPFMRLWFSVVAANRAALSVGTSKSRLSIWYRKSEQIIADAWEYMCRLSVPCLHNIDALSAFGPWGPAGRYWKGNGPEFDIVSLSMDGTSLLLGEVKWSATPFTSRQLEQVQKELFSKGIPKEHWSKNKQVVYALFVPDIADVDLSKNNLIHVIKGKDVLDTQR